ncbi:MAG: sensor domain-containing diguanylate cyclase [Candidatus Acidiferrales bacterium]
MTKQRKRTNRPGGPRGAMLNHAEERIFLLGQAFENSSDLIDMADCEGRFTLVNRVFLRALGYPREEVIGKHFQIVLYANPPALLQDIGANILKDEGWRGECLISHRDGSNFPAFLIVGPVKDREGCLVGSFGIAQDISGRKRVEEALQQSEEQFRQLAENIREVFFVSTPDAARVTYVSPAYDKIWGRPRQEVYDRPAAWIETIHPDDREQAIRVFAQQSLGQPTTMDYRIVRPDASIRWISNRTFPVHDAQGKFCRVVGIAEDVTVHRQEERMLRDARDKLNTALRESEQHAGDAVKLTELVDILQSCQTVEEAYKITGNTLPMILSSKSGALCITSSSRNIVEAVAHWGGNLTTEKTFAPDNCWALRRGKIHLVNDPASPLRCAHVSGSPAAGYLCVPLAAQGETLGILYLESPFPSAEAGPPEEKMAALGRQAKAVGERISLALANLRLRDVLRGQSIRDPLTGLFNRRYMEESLERELRRAARNGQCVSLLMLDIDRFKQFNDTFGHQSGDTLLRALGDFLSQRTRGQDVACRYGGEEFAIILAGASVDAASTRAKLLREELEQLIVEHGGQVMGKITVSIGVSGFPNHGATSEELVHAADLALYRAKAEGRDRIIVG